MSEFNKLWEQLNTINEIDEIKEASKTLNEAYVLDSFDFESEVDYYGAVYCARELVYELVDDPRSAARLSNWAQGYSNWSLEELCVLDDMIGDALEGANYHEDVFDYMRSDPFPYWHSEKVSTSDKAKIDSLITKCKTIRDKRLLLWDAIHAALYSY